MDTNEDLLAFAKFLIDRFYGVGPTDRVLKNAIGDWRQYQNAANKVGK